MPTCSLLAQGLPRVSGLPAQPTPPEPPAPLFHSTSPSQLPRPTTFPGPGRTEGHFSPVQSWTPSPKPAGLSPGGQVSDGSHTQAAPTSVLHLAGSAFLQGPLGLPQAQPPGGSPPQPPSALIAATCVPPGTPSPCLQPQPWSLQLQRKHTHTHAQNQLWNVFLLLHGYGCRECSPST